MKKAILATKVGMTQIFNEDGTLTPVTVLQAGPCAVTQIKTVENDGYEAVQVGFVDKKDKIINKDKGGKKEIVHRHGVTKAEQGHFAKAGVTGKRYVREFKFENASEYELGQEIKADIFAAGDKIDATAISKGKGFQGAIKRHNQSRGPMLMVLSIIAMLVQTVLVQIQVKYSKENTCRDTWEVKRLQSRISWLYVLTLRTTYFWLKVQYRDLRNL